jgi:hypothetical protein
MSSGRGVPEHGLHDLDVRPEAIPRDAAVCRRECGTRPVSPAFLAVRSKQSRRKLALRRLESVEVGEPLLQLG